MQHPIAISIAALYLLCMAAAILPSTASRVQRVLQGGLVGACNVLVALGGIGVAAAPQSGQWLWMALFFVGALPAIIRWITLSGISLQETPNGLS